MFTPNIEGDTVQRFFAIFLGICIFSGVGLVASLAADGAAASDDSATEHSLRIAFADEQGEHHVSPYFNVDGAYPGMPARTALVTLHNSGTLDAEYDVSALVSKNSRGPQLADALQVTVTAEDDRTMYQGPLSGLSFDGAFVAAGASDRYLMAIEWPDGGKSDNAFQGMALEFELRARAREAA